MTASKRKTLRSIVVTTALCIGGAVLATASAIVLLTIAGVLPLERLMFELRISTIIAAIVTAIVAPPTIWKVSWTSHQLQETKAELERQAMTDYLTGVLNRRGFQDAATNLIASAKTDQCPIALIACDIDHFKHVNDTHGHGAGDAVIAEVARRVEAQVAELDGISYHAGRMGGEEFAVIIKNVTQRPLLRLAENIREACADTPIHATDDLAIDTTVSVGTSIASYREADLEDLLTAADRALYRAKRNGRNRVEHGGQSARDRAVA